jgi:hypothetical protein
MRIAAPSLFPDYREVVLTPCRAGTRRSDPTPFAAQTGTTFLQ